MKILVTGGAGFIGSALVANLLSDGSHDVVTVDKLTYAGNLDSLAGALEHPRHSFEQLDICDIAAMQDVFRRHQPDAVMHLAAESHVDRSIDGPGDFVQTNLVGTYTLLEAARAYLETDQAELAERFRFLHVSTDEVYGDLGPGDASVYRDNAVSAQLTLRRHQGRLRPPCPGLGPHIPLARIGQQLLQQLRAAPVSGKAHSTHDPQCRSGQTSAGLR